VTADGRDLTGAEWRTVPDLPKYEVTRDGDVRNARTGRLIREFQDPNSGAWAYSLKREAPGGGLKNTTRTYRSLVRAAYPEDAHV
jgi:hypothetical protein